MSSPEDQPLPDWRGEAARRVRWSRLLSFSLVGGTTLATWYFLVMYGYPTWVILPFVMAYFSLGYLGMTYFVGMWFGFFASLRGPGRDPYHPAHRARAVAHSTRIAILMPVYHEDPRRVGAALGAMWEDLRRHREAGQFDFFLLSDSRKLDSCIQEEWVTHALSEAYPDARFFFRHRRSNYSAKLGNIADFLRRWGSSYKYMIMLDADSIVPAGSLVQMARIMEGNPQIGIVQAYLSMVFRKTLYARINKFASALSLKIGLYGQYYFYLGQGYYYGHNAIIRTAAFMEHCGLPTLRKKGPWTAGKPLSHDYVEAALLEGAGYEIWSLPEIDSFEELPTNMIDDMQREARWMYGSMTYLRVFLISRINPLYRVRLFTSAINYINPMFGWIFLLMSTFGIRYIFHHPFKSYVIMKKYEVVFLFSLGFLGVSILAKIILPIIYHFKMRNTFLFGGLVKLVWSYMMLFVYGLVIGPIYMAQFSRVLYHWIKGEKMHWGEQNRSDRSLTWNEAFRHFWWISATGLALLWLVTQYVFPSDSSMVQAIMHLSRWKLMFWYVPLLFGLIASVWFVRFTSKEFPILEQLQWFASPQDVQPAFVLEATQRLLALMEARVPADIGVKDAIYDPWFYLRHRKSCADRPAKYAFWLPRLGGRRFSDLSEGEKRAVLSERRLYDAYHRDAWLAGLA
jgi:membrane glycosyltransferase